MNTELKHYEKNIDNLSNTEKLLMVIDGAILMSHTINDNLKIPSELKKQNYENFKDLTEKRKELISKLLGIDFECLKTYEVVNIIENSKYGYKKFLEDVEVNKKTLKDIERCSSLN